MKIYNLTEDWQRVKFTREGGAVRRVHTQKIIGEYDVAQHSFNMLCILKVLKLDASKELIWAIVAHDLAERLTGDIPGPAKWFGVVDKIALDGIEDQILSEVGFQYILNEEDTKWLRGLDILELYLWAKDQFNMGNQNARKMIDRIHVWFLSNISIIPTAIYEFYCEVRNCDWRMLNDLGDDTYGTQ